MYEIDISSIVLTPEEETAFRRFRDQDTAVLTRAEFAGLHRYGLVTDTIGGKTLGFDCRFPESGLCELSHKGRAYREHLRRQEKVVKTSRQTLVCAIVSAVLAGIAAVATVIQLLVR